MKAAQYSEFSSESVDGVILTTVPKPSNPKAGHVIVKIHAASLNPADVGIMTGMFKDRWLCPLPFTPGYDLSGVIDSIGEDVKDLKVGDEVFCINWGTNGRHNDDEGTTIAGAFAEFIDLPAHKLSRKAANVSHETTAAMIMVGGTALQALNELKVGAESRVLILGGSSALGTQLVQQAKLRGAHVVTTASTRALSFAQTLGADRVINYNEQNWWEEAPIRSYDAVIAAVTEKDAFTHADSQVKFGGAFMSLADFTVGFNPVAHAPRFSFAAFFAARTNPADRDTVMNLVATGQVRVPIDEVFPFTQEGVTGIFTRVKSGKSLGKNVLKVVS